MTTPDPDQLRNWATAHAATTPVATSIQRQATASPPTNGDDHPVRITAMRPLGEWETGDDAVYAIAMGRRGDGRVIVATGGANVPRVGPAPVRLWDATTGQLMLALEGHTGQVDDVAWRYRDGGHTMLASTGYDGTARIWDPDTGECLRTISAGGQLGDLSNVAWQERSDGRALLAIARSHRSQLDIWDADAGQLMQTVIPVGTVMNLAWATDANGQDFLAIADANHALEIWSPDTEHRLMAFARAHAVAWHQCPDGRLLLASAFHSGARIRVISQGQADGIETICPSYRSKAVAWAPLTDGRVLLAMTDARGLSLWDAHRCERLHTEPLDFQYSGLRHLDWAIASDGRLLLASASRGARINVWEVVLDPAATAGAPTRSRATASRGRLVLPPTEVTPEFGDAEAINETTYEIDVIATADGRMLVASAGDTGAAQLWDLASGSHLRAITNYGGRVWSVSWAQAPDGRLLLATGGSSVQIWDANTGQCLHNLTEPGVYHTVAWTQTTDGRLLIAFASDSTVQVWDADTGDFLGTAEHDGFVDRIDWTQRSHGRALLAITNDRTTRIWDAETGQYLHTLTAHDEVFDLAWTGASDGRLLLATTDATSARIWDADTGQCLHTLTGGGEFGLSAAWAVDPNGPLLLATTDDSGARIWDAETGRCLHTLTDGAVFSAAWAQTSDGRHLLASIEYHDEDATVRIWDPDTSTEIASLAVSGARLSEPQWHRDGQGNLLLLVRNRRPLPGPVRVWLVEAAAEDPETSGSPVRLSIRSGDHLLRLGAGGLWPPIGLVADLVTLTGPAGSAPLHDARLARLAGAAGVDRLRNLAVRDPHWPPDARVAFAALLASALELPDSYTPPADANAADLRRALTDALADPEAGPPWPTPVAELLAAAEAITDKVIALLAILGPDACAADPLLPVQLAHQIPQLPTLSPSELRLLDLGGQPAIGVSSAATAMAWWPGTAGVARTGPVSRLLPTQLALPRDVLIMRLAERQLLYREHRAPVPPAPEPVTIILDTTPPTFGPAGNALRLAAHLIATTLWRYGRYPALVTLTDPGVSFGLRDRADLVRLWASATLTDPGPGLAAARRTAATLAQPVVACLHFQAARDAGLLAGPVSRLLTSHQPPEQPPADPVSPWHVHLPPNPTRAQLTDVVGRLTSGCETDQGKFF